jgi:hypothetical protein
MGNRGDRPNYCEKFVFKVPIPGAVYIMTYCMHSILSFRFLAPGHVTFSFDEDDSCATSVHTVFSYCIHLKE